MGELRFVGIGVAGMVIFKAQSYEEAEGNLLLLRDMQHISFVHCK